MMAEGNYIRSLNIFWLFLTAAAVLLNWWYAQSEVSNEPHPACEIPFIPKTPVQNLRNRFR